MTSTEHALLRLYAVSLKMAHTLSPIDEEVWQALDEADAALSLIEANEEEADDESP